MVTGYAEFGAKGESERKGKRKEKILSFFPLLTNFAERSINNPSSSSFSKQHALVEGRQACREQERKGKSKEEKKGTPLN